MPNGRRRVSIQRITLSLFPHRAPSQAFGRDRDRDDFQRLWYDFLQRHSPEALLGGSGAGASAGAVPNPACQTQSAIPTLLLSTNGASPADRLDLYGAFATYLREQQVWPHVLVDMFLCVYGGGVWRGLPALNAV